MQTKVCDFLAEDWGDVVLPYNKQSRYPIRRGIYVALPDKDPARISIVPAWRKNARLCGITKKSGSIFVK